MVKRRRINHKTLYKLCHNASDKKKYNGKLMVSIATGIIGANVMQSACNMTDTKVSSAIKLGAASVMGLETIKYFFQKFNRFHSERSIIVLLHWIKTRDLSSEEMESRRNEFHDLEYWNSIERLFYRYEIEEEFDNYVFTFILKLADQTIIKEVITDVTYNCYYIDREKEEDITHISKEFFNRKN